jgi:hypothetical protein
MDNYGLGRLPSEPDERDFGVDRLLAMIEAGAAVPVEWADPAVLQQGQTQHCVGFGCAGFIATQQAAAPARTDITDATGHRIYREAKVYDGDPNGENGSTIRSGGKALLHDEKVIAAYAFATYDQARAWVQTKGPVVLGIDWTRAMFTPNAQGVIYPTGTVQGGHCILWRGVDAGDRCLLRNSWGRDWGKGGDCYMEGSDLANLLNQGGEALVAVKDVPVPPKPDPFTDIADLDAEGYAAVHYVHDQGWIGGYPGGAFQPYGALLKRHVALIAGRAGFTAPAEWLNDYSPALRGDVKMVFPAFVWTKEDWEEPLTRVQLCRLIWRNRTT